ncbi:hypothetical protein [Streptomyces gilvosporeus]|uniref:hypothetical protein n=1 Tax=Streptomyces gilvosporeus TaxID=553510 RepID=UPI0033C16AC6
MARRLPDVGDLVTVEGDAKWIVSDIANRGRPTAAWKLRPLYGGGADGEGARTVPKAAIGSVSVIRRRGEWSQP